MQGLHELQREITRGILLGENLPKKRILSKGIAPAQRLAIYRNDTLLGLSAALRDGYPVVNRLVGDEFFDAMARQYVHLHPPRSGCLLEYGDGIPAFLANYPPARGLPYLGDVARLERLWQEAFHEADGAGLDVSALAAVPEEAHGTLRLRLHPSARWMTSDYPVLRIWEVNQPAFAGEDRVSLQEGGCRLLLIRPRLEVEIHRLAAGDYTLLGALAEDATLAEAVERALDADSQFELFTGLKAWIERGLFTHFSY